MAAVGAPALVLTLHAFWLCVCMVLPYLVLLVATLVGGGLHVADEALGTNVVADADRASKGIAKQLSALFGKEGWTS